MILDMSYEFAKKEIGDYRITIYQDEDAYNNSDIILDADNFSGEVIEIEPDQEYWRESEEDDSVALQHID